MPRIAFRCLDRGCTERLPLEDELASRGAGVSVARHAARERLRAIGIACKRLFLRSNKIFNQTS